MKTARQTQILALVFVAMAGYVGYLFFEGTGLRRDSLSRFYVQDVYSLLMIVGDHDECDVAIGYREKYVIGKHNAELVKTRVCAEYFFSETRSTRYQDVAIVLVKLDNGEYHWILESELLDAAGRN